MIRAFTALMALMMVVAVSAFQLPRVQFKTFNPLSVAMDLAAKMSPTSYNELDNGMITEDPEIVPAPKCGFCFG